MARHRAALDGEQAAQATRLVALLGPRRVRLALNDNHRTLVSLRPAPDGGGYRLSLHPGLLRHQECFGDLLGFIDHALTPRRRRQGGRPRFPLLRRAMGQVFSGLAPRQSVTPTTPTPDLPTVGAGGLDLDPLLAGILARHFPDLRPPSAIRWGRDPGRRALHHIRFGCYHRRNHSITLNPRLRLPWIARIFVEHVVHHELCHHVQAMEPIRGERPHSARFRSLERQFPGYDLAMQWERANLARLLDPVGHGAWPAVSGRGTPESVIPSGLAAADSVAGPSAVSPVGDSKVPLDVAASASSASSAAVDTTGDATGASPAPDDRRLRPQPAAALNPNPPPGRQLDFLDLLAEPSPAPSTDDLSADPDFSPADEEP